MFLDRLKDGVEKRENQVFKINEEISEAFLYFLISNHLYLFIIDMIKKLFKNYQKTYKIQLTSFDFITFIDKNKFEW